MGRMGVIAIDGPAGAGKSTVARRVAERLGIRYLDTGALYRALSLWLNEQDVPTEESEALSEALEQVSVRLEDRKVFVNERDVTNDIRTSQVSALTSAYSELSSVRHRLLDLQREQALSGPLVADGRDMGSVVFPLAPVKIFLTASVDVRSRRRWEELQERGEKVALDTLREEILRRDTRDSSRAVAPLVQMPDAMVIDSTDMTIDDVVETIMNRVKEYCHD